MPDLINAKSFAARFVINKKNALQKYNSDCHCWRWKARTYGASKVLQKFTEIVQQLRFDFSAAFTSVNSSKIFGLRFTACISSYRPSDVFDSTPISG